ncbi:MAG: hypothetical protein IT307_18480 [Chloroflexi bacterium]|nr:hypothetical protein [Chloroflexota bacterium]
MKSRRALQAEVDALREERNSIFELLKVHSWTAEQRVIVVLTAYLMDDGRAEKSVCVDELAEISGFSQDTILEAMAGGAS